MDNKCLICDNYEKYGYLYKGSVFCSKECIATFIAAGEVIDSFL